VQTAFLTWSEAATARFQVAETERGDPRTAIATLQRANLALSLTGIAVTAAALFFLRLDPALELAILGAVTASAGRGFFKLRQERNRAEGDVKGYAFIEVTYIAGGFLLGALFAWMGFGAPGVFAGMGVAVVLILARISRGEFRLSAGGRFDPERLRSYLAYGMPITVWLILALVLSSTDRFLIAAFLDEAHVGAYHAGYSVGSRLLDVAFSWLGIAGGPAMVAALERGGRPALERVARDQATLMVRLLLPATVGVVLVADPLTQLLVGEAMRADAARITPWIAVSAFFSGFAAHYLGHAFTLGSDRALHGPDDPARRRQPGSQPGAGPALRHHRRGVGHARQLRRLRRHLLGRRPAGAEAADPLGDGRPRRARLGPDGRGRAGASRPRRPGRAGAQVRRRSARLRPGHVRPGRWPAPPRAGAHRRRRRKEACMTPAAERLTDSAAWAAVRPELSVLIPFHGDDPRPLLAALEKQAAKLVGRVELVISTTAIPTSCAVRPWRGRWPPSRRRRG
jgi:hypothetical protein